MKKTLALVLCFLMVLSAAGPCAEAYSAAAADRPAAVSNVTYQYNTRVRFGDLSGAEVSGGTTKIRGAALSEGDVIVDEASQRSLKILHVNPDGTYVTARPTMYELFSAFTIPRQIIIPTAANITEYGVRGIPVEEYASLLTGKSDGGQKLMSGNAPSADIQKMYRLFEDRGSKIYRYNGDYVFSSFNFSSGLSAVKLHLEGALGISPGIVADYSFSHGYEFGFVDAAQFIDLKALLDVKITQEMYCPVFSLKAAIYKSYYKKKGQAVVDMNNASIEHGIDELHAVEIPAAWLTAQDAPTEDHSPAFIQDVVSVMNRQEGDVLPISTMKKYGLEDGTWPAGTSQYEKRGAAVEVPAWQSSQCIQCNQCSLVCPHAAIRPILLNEDEQKNAPSGFETKQAVGPGLNRYQFRMQVSPYDCTGCGSCANVCPVNKKAGSDGDKALVMQSLDSQLKEAGNWTYAVEKVEIKKDAVSAKTVKNSQFAKPYFEFSGACAGCGETPYIKLVTQLFGERMYITNASGCSSAYGGSTPSSPYCTDKQGRGPAWAMSLFEDNAEYAYGYLLGQDAVKRQLRSSVQQLMDRGVAADACAAYLEKGGSADESRAVSDALLSALAQDQSEEAAFIRQNREYLTKKSVWAFGGDGWAYDIGYGGLDHVLASGKDINVLVLDTEVYSNTGGQSSKSTAAGAIAKFAASGKVTKKKDLGLMAMSYGYVYVAQVSMGADPAQTLRAIREAEAYDGPSLVICYCPCIEHGMKASMGLSQLEEKKAVDAGYWHLYRYNPELKKEGKNPFVLDSKAPTGDFQQFLQGENRYASLKLSFPDRAEKLYAKAEADAKERLAGYQNLAGK